MPSAPAINVAPHSPISRARWTSQSPTGLPWWKDEEKRRAAGLRRTTITPEQLRRARAQAAEQQRRALYQRACHEARAKGLTPVSCEEFKQQGWVYETPATQKAALRRTVAPVERWEPANGGRWWSRI